MATSTTSTGPTGHERAGDHGHGDAHGGHGGDGWVGGLIATLIPLALTVYLATWVPSVAAGEVHVFAWPWLPSLGIELAVQIDGLSLTFGLLIAGIGTIILYYSGAYLHGHPHLTRFYIYMLAFMASMLGVVFADDLITLFVFWELTTLTSFLLIGYDYASAQARRNALQALLVTGLGGLAMLAGLVILAIITGTYRISEINLMGDEIRAHAYYLPILLLFLAGTFTKSAQVPFHFWLPNAMAAPTPVSAYLHSATMVKAGVFLMARMHPGLAGTEAWFWLLLVFGAVTAVVASILAIRQTDLKLALAYTTLMALGTLTMLLASSDHLVIAAAVTFLVVHSLYKSTLFLVIGIVDHETGTREAPALGGLGRLMPITAVVAVLAALSMAGIPPFVGFIGKEMIYEGALDMPASVFVIGAALAANALMVAVAAIVAFRPFFVGRPDTPQRPHDPGFRMWGGPALLAALGLALGLVPHLAEGIAVVPGASAILGQPVDIAPLKLWHGINAPLILSAVTLALGLVLYAVHLRLRAGLQRAADAVPAADSDRAYDRAMDWIIKVSVWQTKLVQTGRLRAYLSTVFVVFAVAVAVTFVARDAMQWPEAWPDLVYWEWAIFLLVAISALVPAFTRSRLTAICALGVVGAGVALVFLMYGAADVAMTQLLVEILVVVLVAVVLVKLPGLRTLPVPPLRTRLRDVVVSIAAGGTVALTVIAVVSGPFDRAITDYFEWQSAPIGLGRNIVNVVLVDFRALDTLGEIAVIAIAGLAVFALLKLKGPRTKGGEDAR